MLPTILSGAMIAPASAVQTVITEPVSPGCLFIAASMFALDADSAIATSIEIGIVDGTRLIPIDVTGGSFAAGISHTSFWQSYLGPGQRVYAKFTTPTQGDHLSVYCHGLLVPMGSPDQVSPGHPNSLFHNPPADRRGR